MTRLSPAAREAVASELAATPRRARAAAVAALAARLGVSPATVYRAARLGGPRRPRAPARPELREWARVATRFRHMAPRPIPWDLALRGAVAAGALPPEAASAHPGTVARVARELGLADVPRRTQRIDADWPMQAVQIDGSHSDRIVAVRQAEDGDWECELYGRPHRAGYKNKPLGPGRTRVLSVALWDICTGFVRSGYMVAAGEASLDVMAFFCSALSRRADPRDPMHGVPGDVWSDLGPFAKSAAVKDLLGRLGCRLRLPEEAHRSERQGGVERSHRTRWERFERALYMARRRRWLLSEINARLATFEVEENNRRPSRTAVAGRRATRAAAWVALCNGRPAPLRELPEHALETLARAARRRVDRNGLVRWAGVEYECAWHSRWVVARRPAAAAAGEGLVLEDERTGEVTAARPLRRRPYGEVRAAPARPLDALLDGPAPGAADVFGEGAAPALPAGVSPLRPRTSPPAALANRLDADALPSLDAAWAAFHAIYPHPLGPHRAAVERRMREAGLGRAAVERLARELAAAAAAAP